MLQSSPSQTSITRERAAEWLRSVEGLDFNTLTPMRLSISDACETIIGWRGHGNDTQVFSARMRLVLERCLTEFQQHEEEARDLMVGVFLEDNPVLTSQHEEKYYQRVALHLSILWHRAVDFDRLRALVTYVVFARIHFLRANLPRSMVPDDRNVIACNAHILLCRFLLYKDRFGRPEPNILNWSTTHIHLQRNLATEQKRRVENS